MYVPVYSSVQYGIEKENNRSFIQRSPQFPMGIATKHTYEEEDSVGRLCASVPFLYQNTTITTYQKKKQPTHLQVITRQKYPHWCSLDNLVVQ